MGSSNAHLRADKSRGESRANDWGKRGHQYPDWMPTRAKPFGTTPGTSVASILSRKYLDYDLKKKILPTLTNASVKRLRFILVRNIAVFVGRAVPVVGWVIAAKDVTMISIRSVSRYNALVRPEDKVF
jgi:hypothetical protein